eukprot:COSAG04_NODE_917_length_9428_cov_3.927109_9_plen_289_part_00
MITRAPVLHAPAPTAAPASSRPPQRRRRRRPPHSPRSPRNGRCRRHPAARRPGCCTGCAASLQPSSTCLRLSSNPASSNPIRPASILAPTTLAVSVRKICGPWNAAHKLIREKAPQREACASARTRSRNGRAKGSKGGNLVRPQATGGARPDGAAARAPARARARAPAPAPARCYPILFISDVHGRNSFSQPHLDFPPASTAIGGGVQRGPNPQTVGAPCHGPGRVLHPPTGGGAGPVSATCKFPTPPPRPPPPSRALLCRVSTSVCGGSGAAARKAFSRLGRLQRGG